MTAAPTYQRRKAPWSINVTEHEGKLLQEEADAAGGHGAGGIIAVPVRVDIPGQAFPARLTLLSRISGWKVEVECGSALGDGRVKNSHSDDARAKRGDSEGEEVKFGPCFVGQSVVKRVSLRNTSQLPLKFGFVSNPAEVS